MPDHDAFFLEGDNNPFPVTAYCDTLVMVWSPQERETIPLWVTNAAYTPEHPANLLSTRKLNERGGFFDETIPGVKTMAGDALFSVEAVPGRKLWRAEQMRPGHSQAVFHLSSETIRKHLAQGGINAWGTCDGAVTHYSILPL